MRLFNPLCGEKPKLHWEALEEEKQQGALRQRIYEDATLKADSLAWAVPYDATWIREEPCQALPMFQTHRFVSKIKWLF